MNSGTYFNKSVCVFVCVLSRKLLAKAGVADGCGRKISSTRQRHRVEEKNLNLKEKKNTVFIQYVPVFN